MQIKNLSVCKNYVHTDVRELQICENDFRFANEKFSCVHEAETVREIQNWNFKQSKSVKSTTSRVVASNSGKNEIYRCRRWANDLRSRNGRRQRVQGIQKWWKGHRFFPGSPVIKFDVWGPLTRKSRNVQWKERGSNSKWFFLPFHHIKFFPK